MSNTVDSRVVEMRFDNKQFESNVATSMSTLDKLKEKLKLTESSKHLNEIGNASKNLDFTSAINGVSALEKRFSVLGIAGMTVIQNLTNSAIQLGGKLTNWFTGGIVQGGITRAMNLEKARFQLQGLLKDTNKVEAVMKNVNDSVDGTAYSLDQAAVVASMFAATGMQAGADMERALKGVAGVAATTSQDYSRVGLIFTQVAGQGRLMGNDLLQLSNLGINAAATLGQYFGKSEAEIRDMVSKGLISFDMFSEAMGETFGDHAKEANKTFTGAMSNVKAALARIGAEFVSPLIVENGPLVKFFNVLRERINEVKETIGPIAKTFTDFVSTIANAATKYLGKLDFSKPFKKFKGLEIGFKKLSKTINNIISPVKKVKENVEKVTAPIDKATNSLKELGDIANDVILGKFGNGQERFDKLAKAGYNYCEVQNKVNEKLGSSVRYTKEQIAKQNKLLGSQKKTISSTEKTEKATSKLTKTQKEQIKKLAKLNDEQLRNRGYTEEQIEAFHELRSAAEKIGMPLDEFIDKMDKINGRWLLIDSFKNIGKSIATIFKSMGSALSDVFSPLKAQGLFNLIASFHKLSTKLVITDEYADKLKRTFRGLFAAIDIVGRVLGGGLRIGLAIVGTILRAFGATTLDVTASLGDLIYKLDEWIKKNDPITKFIELLADKLGPVADKVKEFIENLKTDSDASENFKKIAEGLESIWTVVHGGISKTVTTGIKLLQAVLGLFGTSLGDILGKVAALVTKFGVWIDKNTFITNTLGKLAEIITLVVEGITNLAKAFVALEPVQKMIDGIKNAFSGLGDAFNFSFNGSAIESLYNFIKKIFESIEEWINGLDKSETFKKGLNIVEGLANGIASGVGKVTNAIAGIARNLIDAFCGLLGINSPSKLFMIFGGNIITGLIKGLSKSAFKPIEIIKNIAIKLINAFKSLLGINSPSTVFMSLGAFIILGLLIGLKKGLPEVYDVLSDGMINIFKIVGDIIQNGLPKIYDFIKLIGSKLYSSFEGFDMQVGELFVAGSIIATLLLVKKALGIAETLTKPFAGIAKAIEKFNGVIQSTDKFIKAKALEAKANAIKNLAIAIAIMAASVYLLSRIPLEDLVKGVAAIAVLTGLIIALVAVTSKLNGLEGLAFGKISALMVTLGITLMLFSSAIKRIAELNPKRSAIAVGEMISLITILTAFFAVFGKCVKGKTAENMNKAGIMLLKMSFAIGILAIVIKLMSKLEWDDMAKGGAVIVGIFTIFIAVGKLTKRASKNIDLTATAILKMSFAIGILAIVLRLMSKLEWADLAKGGAVIVGTFTLFWAITKFCKNISKNLDMASVSILKMSAAILLLSIAIRLLGGLEIGYIVKGGVTIAAFFAMFLAMTKLCKNISKSIDLAATAIVKMSAAILLLSVAMLLLGRLKLENVVKGSIAIAAFFAMFWALMKFTKRVSKTIDAAGTAIVKMSSAIILLSVAILLLSMLDPGKVATGTVCVSALLAMFALICHNLKFVGEKSLKSLTIMTVAIAVLAGALIALSFLDIASVITASTCLSAVIGMFALLSYASKYAAGSFGSLIVMTVAIGMIGAALYLLGQLPCEKALAAAGSLSLVLLAMSAALLICSKAMAITPMAILAMAGMTLILLALVGIFAIMNELDIQPSLEVAIALSTLLLAMSGVLMILAGVGAVAGPALIGLGTLLLAVTAIGAFITGVGAIFKYCAGLEGILDKGIEILCKIGHGIGLFIGSIGGGILEGINSGLVSVGKTLSDFMVGLTPFLSGLSTVTPDMAVAAKNLALAILAITGAGILEAIGGWLTGDFSITSITTFAGQLKEFGKGMKAYGNEVSGIDAASIAASAKAARALTKVANNIPKDGGIWQKLAGNKDISSFGGNLKEFGKGIKGYGESVSGIEVSDIDGSVSAAKKIIGVVNATKNVDVDGVKNFVKAVDKLGEADMGSVTSAFSGASSASKMVSAGIKMVKSVGSGIKSSAGSVKSSAKSVANSVASAFKSQTGTMKSAGTSMVRALTSSLNKASGLRNAGKSLVTKVKNGVNSDKKSMTTAGKNLGDGLVTGIRSKYQDAYNAGFKLGKKAVQGEKDGQKSKSPSKETIKAGKWLGEGLIIGIKRIGSSVYSAGYSMGERVTESISSALETVGGLLDSDVDVQPTISPVVDLSNVEAGAGAINSLLGQNVMVGANANLSAINYGMSRNQNGANDDVVSAINKLRKDLGNIGGDTYQINGVTYDDGSNITDAVHTLVRAAKVERRK